MLFRICANNEQMCFLGYTNNEHMCSLQNVPTLQGVPTVVFLRKDSSHPYISQQFLSKTNIENRSLGRFLKIADNKSLLLIS